MTNIVSLNGKAPVENTDKYVFGDAIAATAKDFVIEYDIPETEVIIMGKDPKGALRLVIPSDPAKPRTQAEQHFRLATYRYLLDQLMEQIIMNPVES